MGLLYRQRLMRGRSLRDLAQAEEARSRRLEEALAWARGSGEETSFEYEETQF